MSQRIPQSGQELFSLPDFHDDEDLFDDDEALLTGHSQRRRILILLSIILLALLFLGTVLFIKHRPHIVYQAQKIVQSDLVLSTTASGSLHTNVYTVNVAAGGKLAEIDVTVGQQVKKGQVLAKLDPTSLQNALDEAQLSVEVAQTALDNANANYAAIQTVADQSGSVASTSNATISSGKGLLANSPSSPAASAGAAIVQETEAQGQIKAAQRELALAQTKLDIAKYNLNNTFLKAPHDGTVATLDGAVGGEPGATFIQIVDSSSLQLQADVREADIGAVATGDGVRFSVDAYPGQSFNGNVVTVSPLSQSTAGVITYPVWINIASVMPASVHLFPGMSVHATVTTKERTDVLLVPASALTFAQASEKPHTDTNNQSIIEHTKIQSALNRANDMLQNAQEDISQENPTPAVVLEHDAYDKIIAVPIVVGLTDGREYEVLDGLSVNDVVLVGAKTSNN